MNFFGKYRDDKEEKMIAKSLERVKYRYDEKDHSHHFFIKDRKQKAAEDKEKGFWAWVKRQFS
jgi:predicted Zn-dependent protease